MFIWPVVAYRIRSRRKGCIFFSSSRRSFDDSELVRPDIFSPTKEEFHRNTRIFGGKKGHRRGPEAPQYEDGGEFGVEHDNLDDKEAGQKPGDLAFNQIVHDLMEDMNEVEER